MVDEEHSRALREWTLGAGVELVSCDLLRAELMRTARRLGAEIAGQAQAVIDSIELLPVPGRLFAAAGALDPPGLRTLDALHLAAALDLGDDLDGLVGYDQRLIDAALLHGVRALSPA